MTKDQSTHRRNGVPGVEISGLVKRFGEARALDGLNLLVPAGAVYGILGPNGAGKTTMVRILATLLRPDGGSAWRHAFVDVNPVSLLATAVRHRMAGTATGAEVAGVVLAAAAITAVFAPLTMRLYRTA